MFKERQPNTPLPPEPVLTRWGTWLDAAIYYADTFGDFRKIINEFPESSSEAIKECQSVLKDKELQDNLAYFKSNFSYVSRAIKSLEKQGTCVVDAVEIINNFKDCSCAAPGCIGESVRIKLEQILSKNVGYQVLEKISAILKGDVVSDFTMDPGV